MLLDARKLSYIFYGMKFTFNRKEFEFSCDYVKSVSCCCKLCQFAGNCCIGFTKSCIITKLPFSMLQAKLIHMLFWRWEIKLHVAKETARQLSSDLLASQSGIRWVLWLLKNGLICMVSRGKVQIVYWRCFIYFSQDFHLLVADPRNEKLCIEVKDTMGFADLTVGTAEVGVFYCRHCNCVWFEMSIVSKPHINAGLLKHGKLNQVDSMSKLGEQRCCEHLSTWEYLSLVTCRCNP